MPDERESVLVGCEEPFGAASLNATPVGGPGLPEGRDPPISNGSLFGPGSAACQYGEQRGYCFGISYSAFGDHLRHIGKGNGGYLDLLVGFRSRLSGGKLVGHEHMHDFVAITRGDVEAEEGADAASGVAGLFLQFADGAPLGMLTLLQRSRGDLKKPLCHRMAVLVDHQHPIAIEKRYDGHGPTMLHDLSKARCTRIIGHKVSAQAYDTPLVDAL